MIVTSGSMALRMRMLEHDTALFNAFGARGADIIETQHVQQIRASNARNDRHRDRAERDRGQDQMLERIAKHLPVAGDQRIEQVTMLERKVTTPRRETFEILQIPDL